MIRRPPRSTRTDTLFPYPTLFRSHQHALAFECAALKRVAQRGGIQPHAVGGQQFELVAAEAEQLEPLAPRVVRRDRREYQRSEEHTSELQSLMRISYAVFCLKKKNKKSKKSHM